MEGEVIEGRKRGEKESVHKLVNGAVVDLRGSRLIVEFGAWRAKRPVTPSKIAQTRTFTSRFVSMSAL